MAEPHEIIVSFFNQAILNPLFDGIERYQKHLKNEKDKAKERKERLKSLSVKRKAIRKQIREKRIAKTKEYEQRKKEIIATRRKMRLQRRREKIAEAIATARHQDLINAISGLAAAKATFNQQPPTGTYTAPPAAGAGGSHRPRYYNFKAKQPAQKPQRPTAQPTPPPATAGTGNANTAQPHPPSAANAPAQSSAAAAPAALAAPSKSAQDIARAPKTGDILTQKLEPKKFSPEDTHVNDLLANLAQVSYTNPAGQTFSRFKVLGKKDEGFPPPPKAHQQSRITLAKTPKKSPTPS
ncbi:MAG: hypothetical protein ABTQ34_00140 [Bdellovibrionales bacterium]